MSAIVSLGSRRAETGLRLGLLRLTDSAPAIVAQEFGWFAEEGIEAELHMEPSWANIADKLAYGLLDAAIILPPLAFAVELGLRGIRQPLLVPCSVSHGGNTVTLSRDLAQKADAQLGTGPPAFQGHHFAHGLLSRCTASCSATNSATIWASLRLSFIAFFCSQR